VGHVKSGLFSLYSQGKGHRILLNVMSLMGMFAILILWPPGSQAQRGGGLPVNPPPTTRPPSVSVPEPSTSVLLLLGIGLTGLASYSLKRRKHGE
jgi:hypothetical protein